MPLACKSCGAPASEDDRFCSRCGSPSEASEAGTASKDTSRTCSRCGFVTEPSDRFCRNCGSSFGSPLGGPATEGDGFEDILAGWDLDLPPSPFDQQPASPAHPTAAAPTPVTTGPPSATGGPPKTSTPPAPTSLPPVETAVLDRPAPANAEAPFLEEEPLEFEELPLRRPSLRRASLRGAPRAGMFPWGATFALLGAVTVIISAVLPWDSGAAVLPRDVPAALLLDPTATVGPNLGLVLLGLGTVGALVALLTMAMTGLSIFRRLIGALTFAVPLAFVMRALGLGAFLRPTEIIQALGIGAFAAALGGLIQFLAGRWSFGRR